MSNRPTDESLRAAPDDPRISVHELSEFVFCPRAGLVAQESQKEDTGRESGTEHLDYLPEYNLLELQRHLKRAADQVTWLLGAMALALVATVVAMILFNAYWIVAGLLVVCALIGPTVSPAKRLWVLARRYAAYERAGPRQPNLESAETESIGWWELHKAGFDATSYQGPLLDDELRLIGRPWRVLRRESWVIPVFTRRRPGPLRPQQFARIAAYCQLIAICEQVESPFGVVLDPGRYEATIIKNTPTAQRQFAEGLRLARRIVLASQAITDTDERRRFPAPPQNRRTGIRCPVGRPRRYRFGHTETDSYGQTLAPYGEIRNGQTYHSPCADRFCWTPPHESAFAWGWLDEV